jgi:dephospho-CoA kinase
MAKTVIGILGAIGSGKSQVASLFEALGCGVIYADRISHQVLEREDIRAKIADIWGPEVVGSGGAVDRKRLGEAVFDDPEKLKVLTSILHPEILRIIESKIRSFEENPDISAIVLDVPLLMEVGWHVRCDFLIYVETREDIRHQRLERCRNLDKNQQKKRENLQISLDKKKEVANFIIENNSDVSDLAKQVEKIYSAIPVRR